jgi:hypothetical protein
MNEPVFTETGFLASGDLQPKNIKHVMAIISSLFMI